MVRSSRADLSFLVTVSWLVSSSAFISLSDSVSFHGGPASGSVLLPLLPCPFLHLELGGSGTSRTPFTSSPGAAACWRMTLSRFLDPSESHLDARIAVASRDRAPALGAVPDEW